MKQTRVAEDALKTFTITGVTANPQNGTLTVQFDDGFVGEVALTDLEQSGLPIELDIHRVTFKAENNRVLIGLKGTSQHEIVPWDLLRALCDPVFAKRSQHELTRSRRILGQTIKRLRNQHTPPLTQEALAQRAEINRITLANIEAGRAGNPTLTTLKKIASGLNVQVADLLNDN